MPLLEKKPHTSSPILSGETSLGLGAMGFPKAMRQQVRESYEDFPLSGGRCQPVIEPSIDDQVLTHRIGNRPQIPHCVAVLEWLGEAPYLNGNHELPKRVGNGEGLSKLCSTHLTLSLLGDYPVHVDVETMYLVTHKD